jgi:hypothetical protein
MNVKCKDVREQLKAEALCCLSPKETPSIGFKVNTIVTYRGIEIPMRFLEKRCGLQLYYDAELYAYYLYKDRRRVKTTICPPPIDIILRFLDFPSIEYMMLMHSVFCNMMRQSRKFEVDAAAADAVDAATAAADAAYAVVAADAAADAAYAVVAADDAVDAVYAVYAAAACVDAAYADDARKYARAAFKHFIQFRKIMRDFLCRI